MYPSLLTEKPLKEVQNLGAKVDFRYYPTSIQMEQPLFDVRNPSWECQDFEAPMTSAMLSA